MLFILGMVCTAQRWPALWAVQEISRINNVLKWANSGETWAGKVELGSYDGAWRTDHDGTTLVSKCWIIMELAEFFVHHDDAWHTWYHASFITNIHWYRIAWNAMGNSIIHLLILFRGQRELIISLYWAGDGWGLPFKVMTYYLVKYLLKCAHSGPIDVHFIIYFNNQCWYNYTVASDIHYLLVMNLPAYSSEYTVIAKGCFMSFSDDNHLQDGNG